MSNVRQMVKAHVLHNLSPYCRNILGAVERPAWLPHQNKGGQDPQEGRVNRPHPHPDNPVDLTRVGAEMTSSPGVPLTHCGIPRVTKSPQTPYQECFQPFTISSCHHISAAFERLSTMCLSSLTRLTLVALSCRRRLLNNFRDCCSSSSTWTPCPPVRRNTTRG